MKSKPKILMITGLDHSGTTILDLALGAAPSVRGVGEALRMCDVEANVQAINAIRDGRASEIFCSCGQPAPECRLWGGLLKLFAPDPSSEVFEARRSQPAGFALERPSDGTAAFSTIASTAARLSPFAEYVVDSSPNGWIYLPTLVHHHSINVIHLVRDIRSWTYSRQKRRNKGFASSCWVWSRGNRAIEVAIARAGVRCLRIGYEELALRPELTLRTICAWSGLTFEPAMLEPYANTNSHILVGNSAAQDAARVQTIRYDGSWLANPAIRFPQSLLMLPFVRQNQRMVYSNAILMRRT